MCIVSTWAMAAPAARTGPIVVFGDSLSAAYGLRPEEGWVALLSLKLVSAGYGLPVVNASVSGETTTGGRARIGRVLSTHHPSVLILELGANDALRGLPAAGIEDNLISIVDATQRAGAQILLVGTPVPGNYGDEYAESVAQAYRNAARRTHTKLVPSLLAGIAPDPSNFQADRLHPAAAVQRQMLESVWPTLQSLIPKNRH